MTIHGGRRRQLGVLSLFVLFTIGLVSCGGGEEVQLEEAKGGKKYGGIYRMNEVQDLRTLDPVGLNDAPSHHIVHQIYDMLVDFDSTLTLQPELAESWEVSEDGMTYTYHIRKGVTFHDSPAFPDGKGREMTAKDVKYSFDRILDARSGTRGATYFLGKVKGAQAYFDATSESESADPAVLEAGVSGFRVVDDYTFVIELAEPFAAFKYYPALGFCYIYPREAVEHFGKDFFRNPVGTGPFMFDNWKKDQELTLVRNPNYWQTDGAGNRLPLLEGVRISFLKDEKQQINEFRAGNLEESYRIPSEFFRNVVAEDGSLTPEYSEYVLHRIPALSTQYYGMLTTSDAFSDPRVRKAFNYAVDRKKIIEFVLQGQAAGPAVHGIVPPSMPGYAVDSIEGYDFDPEKARALMAEAGYPNGKGFPKVTLQLNSGGGRNQLIAEAVQEMLKSNLGIDVGLKMLEWAQHLELVDNGEAPFFRLGWIADYPDPENFLNLLWSKNIPASGASPINSTRFRSRRFDSLFEIALRTLDDAERFELYRRAEQIAVDETPMLFIINDMDYRLVQPYVRGYSSNAMDRRDFKGIWFDFTNGADNANPPT